MDAIILNCFSAIIYYNKIRRYAEASIYPHHIERPIEELMYTSDDFPNSRITRNGLHY